MLVYTFIKKKKQKNMKTFDFLIRTLFHSAANVKM